MLGPCRRAGGGRRIRRFSTRRERRCGGAGRRMSGSKPHGRQDMISSCIKYEIRCPHCGRLHARGRAVWLEWRCQRCKRLVRAEGSNRLLYTLFRAPKSAGWETIPLALSCFISVVGMDRGWLKIRDAAAWAGISPKTLRNWLGGGLRHSRVGGIILIRRETLDEWLESHAVDAGQIDRLVNEVLREVSG